MLLVPWVVLVALLHAGDDDSRPAAGDVEAYRTARNRAGRDVEAHVQLALWCEEHHLDAEHGAELAEALRLSPHNSLARGLMGQVRVGERWLTPQEVARQQDEPRRRLILGDYDTRRLAAGDTVKGNLALARWCSSQGLRGKEFAHLTAVIRRDPSHAEAWRALGYHQREGVWVNPAHEMTERRLHTEAREAHRRWTNRLKDLMRERFAPEKRAAVDAEISKIHDPEAVAAIVQVLGKGSIEVRQLAARILGEIDGPRSTSGLARLAILDPEGPVRGDAGDVLARRDPREFIGPIIDYVRKPPKMTFTPPKGPGEPGKIEVEGMEPRVYLIPTMEEFRVGTGNPPAPIDTSWLTAMASRSRSSYSSGGYSYTVSYYPADPVVVQAFTQLAASPGEATPILRGLAGLAAGKHSSPPPVTYGVFVPYTHTYGTGYPRALAREMLNQIRNNESELRNQYNAYCAEVRKQFIYDSETLREHAATIDRTSRNAVALLQQVTGLELGLEQAIWATWWAGWNESEPKVGPTAAASAPAIVPRAVQVRASTKLHRPRLATGTQVWTSRGQKPVESLRVGDLVLSQDPSRGTLSYQGVVAITAPEPDAVLRLRLDGGGPIVVSVLEPVWKAGAGWVQSRDLKPGDAVRVVGGRATMVSVDPDPDAPVVNVVLADDGTLFAGDRGLLVHDNTIVHPPARPFDTVPERANPIHSQ